MDLIAPGGTLLKQQQEVDTPPNCFGKLFDGSSAECVGGHDPAYYDPETGSQLRHTCDWVSSCSARTAANKLIPASNLVRPQQQTPYQAAFQTKFTQPTAPVQTSGWRPPQTYTPPHMQQQHGVQQMMSVNFGIPQYLTIREPQTTGRNFGQRLFSETVRSMLKSIGHTFAHFFDVEVFGPPPGGGNSPGQ